MFEDNIQLPGCSLIMLYSWAIKKFYFLLLNFKLMRILFSSFFNKRSMFF